MACGGEGQSLGNGELPLSPNISDPKSNTLEELNSVEWPCRSWISGRDVAIFPFFKKFF